MNLRAYDFHLLSRPRILASAAFILLSAAPVLNAAEAGADAGLFVGNVGQWPEHVRYVGRSGELQIVVHDDGWDFVTQRVVDDDPVAARVAGVRLAFTFGGAEAYEVAGEDARPGAFHYFHGNDPSQWATDAPLFTAVRLDGLASGVDLVLGFDGSEPAMRWELAPDADATAVELAVDGADTITQTPDGMLAIETAEGLLQVPTPIAAAGGTPRGTSGAAGGSVLAGGGGSTLAASAAPSGLVWSSYLGSTSLDFAYAVDLDAAGRPVTAGYTYPSAFPTTTGSYDEVLDGGREAFVSCMAADGTQLQYSTFLGGTQSDEVRGLAVGADGSVTVVGWTASATFPRSVTAFDTTFAGGSGVLGSDAFVTRLSADGSGLIFSTLLGAGGDDLASDVGLAADGGAIVVGHTAAAGFPTTPGAPMPSFLGGSPDGGDAFVTHVAPDGQSLTFSTLLGGVGDDIANAVAVDAAGAVFVAGWTSSSDFPLAPGAYDTQLAGYSDAFVARLLPDGSAVDVATLLGGSSDDSATALAVDGAEIVVTGTTRSPNFPSTAGDSYAGGAYLGDVFTAKLDRDLGQLGWARQLGGAADDSPGSVAVDVDGSVLVGGWTASPTFPTTPDAADSVLDGASDAFFLRLDALDGTLLHSSLLGGTAADEIVDVAPTASGTVLLAGGTTSDDFPVTPGAWDESFDGFVGFVSDAFLAEVVAGTVAAPATVSWTDLGFAMPGSGGVAPRLDGVGDIELGSTVTLSLVDAPPSSSAWVFISDSIDAVPLLGGTFVPYPFLGYIAEPTGPTGGFDIVSTVLDVFPSGTTFSLQAWVLDPSQPQGIVASNAISRTVP